MSDFRFKVQIYDFACQNLIMAPSEYLAGSPGSGQGSRSPIRPFLKVDFGNYKAYQTDVESNPNPEWGFKAGFQYQIPFLEKLKQSKCRIDCINKATGLTIGISQVDLQTIACGPSSIRLTLRDPHTQETRGSVSFICVMKMTTANLAVLFKHLRLTMLGCEAAAKLSITCSLINGRVVRVPHSPNGVWEDSYKLDLSCETCLSDLLKAPVEESLHVEVMDDAGNRQGESTIPFRTIFTPGNHRDVALKVPVTYSYADENKEGERVDAGTVGELEGVIVYQGLPSYAQMVGGVCVDGEVEGGNWLIEGLPFPESLTEPPPVWKDPDENGLGAFKEFLHMNPDDPDGDLDLDNIDDETFLAALEQIDLPPPWEKRQDSGSKRTYFVEPRSKRTTWKDPRFLPENWDQRIDPNTGKVYWQYHKTRQSTFVDPRGCPPGWDMRLSKAGDVYFAYTPAMQTTWQDPRGLPDSTDPALDDAGRLYFKCHNTKSTTWEDPRGEQQEVVLTQWRQAQATRWWKEMVFRELEEMEALRNAEPTPSMLPEDSMDVDEDGVAARNPS